MSAKVKSYKDLVVWQKSITLVKLVYQLTRSFLDLIEEVQKMTNALRRSLASRP